MEHNNGGLEWFSFSNRWSLGSMLIFQGVAPESYLPNRKGSSSNHRFSGAMLNFEGVPFQKLTWLAGISPCLIADTSFKWLSFLCHVSFRGVYPSENERMSPKRNDFNRKFHLPTSNYHFSGSMLGFRGVSLSGPQKSTTSGGWVLILCVEFLVTLIKGIQRVYIYIYPATRSVRNRQRGNLATCRSHFS